MINRRPYVLITAVSLSLLTALILIAPVRASGDGGNPYGPGVTTTKITLHPDGSYRVVSTQSRELRRTYRLDFGGAVHDGFRLPDERGQVLPPYLRASYAMESVTLDGEPVELAFQTDRHRVEAVISDERPTGRHTAVFSYSVSGASLPTRDGWQTHIRLLNRGQEADDVITIEAAPGVAAIGVRCVTFAPDAYPCGSKAADQSWSISKEQTSAPEHLVIIKADPTRVPAPTLDRT
jgi:hypothetical protein